MTNVPPSSPNPVPRLAGQTPHPMADIIALYNPERALTVSEASELPAAQEPKLATAQKSAPDGWGFVA